MPAVILDAENLKHCGKVHLTGPRRMEEKLPTAKFMRIHCSCVVGLSPVAAVGHDLVQAPRKTLPVSYGYREVVDMFFAS